jgi:hypothetical protein
MKNFIFVALLASFSSFSLESLGYDCSKIGPSKADTELTQKCQQDNSIPFPIPSYPARSTSTGSERRNRNIASVDNSATDPSWENYGKSCFVTRMTNAVAKHLEHPRKIERLCCLHVVKQFLVDACFVSERPPGENAGKFGKYLKSKGFQNILPQVAAKGNLAFAPKGAILVYKTTPIGGPGHIEVKDNFGTSTYSSFYNSEPGVPRSGSEVAFKGKFKGNYRELIGIYILPNMPPPEPCPGASDG